MELKPPNKPSSNITGIGYDPDNQELQIEFKGGGVYAYDSVPADVHEALDKAESIGKHFHKHIKDQYVTRKLK